VTVDPVQFLRQHGLQVTAQRVAVLRVVMQHPHSPADAIAQSVREEIGTISKQAVYDTLSVLTEKRIVRQIQPAGSPSLYETRVGDNHHHVICRECGAMADVDCVLGHAPCLDPSHTAGFQIDEAEVTFWGLCPACVRASRAK
jgi:Fur family ferric uptake transcriptional regulator